MFDAISQHFGPFDVDLFASRLNYKVPKYNAWALDPYCDHVDSFIFEWSPELYYYTFLPFSLLLQTICKLLFDQATVTMVVPTWPNQSWFSLMLDLLAVPPLDLPQYPLPYLTPHPVRTSLNLISVKTTLINYDVLPATARYILGKFAFTMIKTYNIYYKKWKSFCLHRKVDKTSPSLRQLLDFFTCLADLNYSCDCVIIVHLLLCHILSAKSQRFWIIILSKIYLMAFTKLILYFQSYPKLPGLVQVVEYLALMPSNHKLSLMQLSQKTVVLILLATMQWKCELHCLTLTKMTKMADCFTFLLTVPSKNYSTSYNACQEFKMDGVQRSAPSQHFPSIILVILEQ